MKSIFLDIGFYILVPEDVPLFYEIKQEVFNWGGIDHPQGEKYYYVSPRIKLTEAELDDYAFRFMPEQFRTFKWRCLRVNDECLSSLYGELHGEFIDWQGLHPDQFLQTLLSKHSAWIVYLFRNQDEIDFEFNADIAGLIEILHFTLRSTEGLKGFVVHAKDPNSP